ncbi:HNH endonuclease signature motif containing protein [Terrabacter sp. BE26]|uniref:HNH endonuclease signature motif containing protein n=1 Tax=Terrabacter sp. BE26 TaxID=2898152 RepID=UPI0035BE9367
MISQIERLEVRKARLEGQLVDAYAALHSIEEQHLARTVTSAPVPLSADQVAAQEIAWATGVGAAEVSRRLELATAPRRHRVLRERLRAGTVSLYRALRVVAESRELDDDVLPDLEAAVLEPAPDGSIASQRLFASRLQRCVRSADGRSKEERRHAATKRRSVHGRIVEDGMGTFTVVAPAERVVGVLDRVDALARAARAAGDARSLDQLRSDFLCDLVLFGIVPSATCSAGSCNVAPGAAASAPGGPGVSPFGLHSSGGTLSGPSAATSGGPSSPSPSGPSRSADGPNGSSAGGARDEPRAAVDGRFLSGAPPAVVRIVVPFEVAVGLSDAACELPGHVWVTAAHARAIMTAPGSVWQRLAVDVHTGRALELSTDRYTPTREMVEHVKAVDGVCRAPGCQVPAERCDWDHLVPWPKGPTHVSNGDSLSRGCHNGKTAGVWDVRRADDDGIQWTSIAGRHYITYPKDWREALSDPGAAPPPIGSVPDAARTRSSPPDPDDEPPPF